MKFTRRVYRKALERNRVRMMDGVDSVTLQGADLAEHVRKHLRLENLIKNRQAREKGERSWHRR